LVSPFLIGFNNLLLGLNLVVVQDTISFGGRALLQHGVVGDCRVLRRGRLVHHAEVVFFALLGFAMRQELLMHVLPVAESTLHDALDQCKIFSSRPVLDQEREV